MDTASALPAPAPTPRRASAAAAAAATVAAAPVSAASSALPDSPARDLDRLREAVVARMTGGLSPESLTLAALDWAIHLAGAPGKRLELWLKLMQPPRPRVTGERPATPPNDPRFAAPAWQQWPFAGYADLFLHAQDWWRTATRGVPGTAPHSEDVVAFVARQLLDTLSPSNYPWTNPEVIARAVSQGGLNFFVGAINAAQDALRRIDDRPPEGTEPFAVGRDVAVTPGKVVLRNRLVELIQYAPSTPSVRAEPVLLVPAWIMKYYILDLSAQNSLVRWLVAQGHTVFCVSWRNVGEDDRDLGLDDYRQLGVMAALDAVNRAVPGERVHAVGYCLGGTLLAIAAAAMARAGDPRLASMTLFAAQTDFTEPGELALFIDPSQVHMLDAMMWRRGYLTADQMSGAFQMLQSNDLIWSRVVHEYLMGERAPLSDLMAWNADSTRMPYRMHSEYLHRLFLGNDLAAGRYLVDGHPVALQNLHLPVFVVGTERDHVAPWRSVYKLHFLTDTELTFVLTSGGHNVGIVNPPGPANRHYRIATRPEDAGCVGPDEWQAAAPLEQGSWWPVWQRWLVAHGGDRRVDPRPPGGGSLPQLADAPGTYVLQR